MELWIRSQDKEKLIKCNDIAIATDTEDGKTIRGYKIVGYFDKQTEYEELGFYTLHSRALEILDEIQSKIKQTFLCKPEFIKSTKDLIKEEFVLEQKYHKEFIYEPKGTKIIPLNADVIIYEMPKKIRREKNGK